VAARPFLPRSARPGDSRLGRRKPTVSHRPLPYASPHRRTRVPFTRPGAERRHPGAPAEFAASLRRDERCGHAAQNWTIRMPSSQSATVVAGVNIRQGDCANSPPSGRPSQSCCVIAPTEPASGRRRLLAGSVMHAYCLGCLRDPGSRAASQPSCPARISAGPGCWRWNSSPHRAPPVPGLALAVTEAGWHRLRARRRCPALASPRSSDTSWYAYVTCRRAGSRSRPAAGRASGRPHRIPTSPRPRRRSPQKTHVQNGITRHKTARVLTWPY